MKNLVELLQPNKLSMKTPAYLGKNENIWMSDSFELLQPNSLSMSDSFVLLQPNKLSVRIPLFMVKMKIFG